MKYLPLLPLLFLQACHFGYPDENEVVLAPSYARDVLPIFEKHCLLCHGYPQNRGAPTTFRLDVYDDGDTYYGAYSESDFVQEYINNDRMPPAAKWGDGLPPNDKQTINNWVNLGALP